jgi:opacity protein-like surface antigen
MSPPTRVSTFNRNPHGITSGLLAGALLVSFLAVAQAQDAVQPSGAAPSTGFEQPVTATAPPPPPVQINPADESNFQVVEGDGAAGYAPQPRRFQYALHLTMRAVYDDNINVSHTDPVSDFYFTIEPSVTAGFGDIEGRQENYIRLDYAPSAFLFVEHSENDALQHLFKLEGHYRFSRLDLTLIQEVQILDGADLNSISNANVPGSQVNLDVSRRTRANIFTTQLNANYELTGKTSISAGLTNTVNDYPNLISSQVISGNVFINYRYREKIVVGLGGTGGYNFVDEPNPDQTFEQANVRVSYQAAGKLSFNASGGVEFRQFEQSSRGQYVSPVFEIGADYQPFDGTTMSLSLSRRILNSAILTAQDYALTAVSLGARQRIFQRAYLGFNVGYQNADYFSTVSGIRANRSDDYFFVEPALDVMITRFWTVGGYYLHRNDESSDDRFTFDDNQVGLRTVLTF